MSALPTIVEAIDLEAEHLPAGKHELAVRDRFGITPARYQQILARYLETDEAARHNPLLVHSLRARREVQTAARAARTLLTHRKDQS
jgi:hypothetical protein